MTSTQRSESANHMLKRFIQRAAPMHLFVAKFNEFQSDRNDQEGKEGFVTNQVNRKLRTGLPIEDHAHTIYTRAMYEKFYDELFESSKYTIKSKIGQDEYVLTDARADMEDAAAYIHVRLQGTDRVTCECGLFEHMGMLCRHALKVLVHLDRQEIPPGNILHRWTKDCVERSLSEESKLSLIVHNDKLRKKMLLDKVFEIANREATLSETAFHQAMDAITGSSSSDPVLANSDDPNILAATFTGQLQPTACPPRTVLGGRPPNTGLKSWLTSRKRPPKDKENTPSNLIADWPEEENPSTKKKRSLSDILYN